MSGSGVVKMNIDLFLGMELPSLLRLAGMCHKRNISLEVLLDRYDKLDPVEHEEWRQHFGVLAEIYDDAR